MVSFIRLAYFKERLIFRGLTVVLFRSVIGLKIAPFSTFGELTLFTPDVF